MILIWIVLLSEFITDQDKFHSFSENVIFYYAVLIITLFFLGAMFVWGRAGKNKNGNYTVIDFEKRGVKNK